MIIKIDPYSLQCHDKFYNLWSGSLVVYNHSNNKDRQCTNSDQNSSSLIICMHIYMYKDARQKGTIAETSYKKTIAL